MTRQQEEGERRIEICLSAATEAKATYIRALHEERCGRDLRAEACRKLNERRREAGRSALTATRGSPAGSGAERKAPGKAARQMASSASHWAEGLIVGW